MDGIIKDGTGAGYVAKVDSENHLHTFAVTQTLQEWHAIQGDGYNVNTGNITLTNASASAVYYLKNNEDRDIIITSLVYLIDDSTGGTAALKCDVDRNPTGGTIVDTATASAPVNRNHGSAKTLTVDSYSGAQGNTLTGADASGYISSLIQPGSRAALAIGSIVLPKGASMGVRITPPTGNTSVTIQFAAQIMLLQDNFKG